MYMYMCIYIYISDARMSLNVTQIRSFKYIIHPPTTCTYIFVWFR